VVNPQVDGVGVPDRTAVGTGEAGSGSGVTFALPGNTEVQPAAKRAAASRTIQIPGMIAGCFIADLICGDIRSLPYLWIYLTAKILEVIGFHKRFLQEFSLTDK